MDSPVGDADELLFLCGWEGPFFRPGLSIPGAPRAAGAQCP